MIENETGSILDVNKAACDIYGYTRDALVSMKNTDVSAQPDDTRGATRKELSSVPVRYHRKKDGTVFPVEIKASHFVRKGRRVHIAAIRDITERIHAEEALKESEERHRSIFNTVAEGLYQSTREGRFLSANPALAKMYGYASPEELIHAVTSIGEQLFVHPDERVNALKILEREGELRNFVARRRRRNGDVIWIRDNARAIRDEAGKTLHYAGTIEDITQHVMTESALRESEQKYRSIFENAVEGVFQINLGGRLLTANPAFARIVGYESPESLIASVQDVGKQLYVQESDRHDFLRRMREQAVLEGYEVRWYRRDKRIIWVSISARAVKDDQGRIRYFDGTLEDITRRKRTEEELQEATERLRQTIDATIDVIIATVERRDPYTAGHQKKVSDLARAIASEMHLSPDQIEAVRLAGSIHDIGKIHVPAEVLVKPEKLTGLEYSLVKEHARSGYEILKNAILPFPLADIVHQHHERLDGSGYPNGLRGEEICIEARILVVADVVESMSSHRPYRPSLGLAAALEEIAKNRGVLYDADVVDACGNVFRNKGYAFPEA